VTIALVTGASRGMGRGIALSLGDIGATVYVTGRTRTGSIPVDGAPGTLDETAALVTERGGTGIPVTCDHTDDLAIAELMTRVASDTDGRLDLLVNNAWAGYENYDYEKFAWPFWEAPFASRWDGMFTGGVRATLATTHAAMPLLLQSHGLIVNIAAGDRGRYLGAVVYDTAKTAIARATATLAHETRPHGVKVVCVYPGFTHTERVAMAGGQGIESPEYTGRAIAALATDPDVMARSGGAYPTGQLARDYNVTDVDGTQPEVFYLPDELVLEPPTP
jgi:NAD(P)-dependent dehydrogenase (short-subunit alcohol dehydrogenase family)